MEKIKITKERVLEEIAKLELPKEFNTLELRTELYEHNNHDEFKHKKNRHHCNWFYPQNVFVDRSETRDLSYFSHTLAHIFETYHWFENGETWDLHGSEYWTNDVMLNCLITCAMNIFGYKTYRDAPNIKFEHIKEFDPKYITSVEKKLSKFALVMIAELLMHMDTEGMEIYSYTLE